MSLYSRNGRNGYLVRCCFVLFFQEQNLAGYLLFGRTQDFLSEDMAVATRLAKVGGAMLRTLRRPGLLTRLRGFFRMSPAWIAALVLIIIGLIPAPSAVLGLGEVVPLEPSVVRSPVDGIVQRMVVEPFDTVLPGQNLVTFEQLKIDNQIAVARENLASAEEAMRQAQQGALGAGIWVLTKFFG